MLGLTPGSVASCHRPKGTSGCRAASGCQGDSRHRQKSKGLGLSWCLGSGTRHQRELLGSLRPSRCPSTTSLASSRGKATVTFPRPWGSVGQGTGRGRAGDGSSTHTWVEPGLEPLSPQVVVAGGPLKINPRHLEIVTFSLGTERRAAESLSRANELCQEPRAPTECPVRLGGSKHPRAEHNPQPQPTPRDDPSSLL